MRTAAVALVLAFALGGCGTVDPGVTASAEPALNPPTLPEGAVDACLAARQIEDVEVVGNAYSAGATLAVASLMSDWEDRKAYAGRVRAYLVQTRWKKPGVLGLKSSRTTACVVDAAEGYRYLSSFKTRAGDTASHQDIGAAAVHAYNVMAKGAAPADYNFGLI